MTTFDLTIVTPSGEAFSGETEYLSVMLPDGRAGFMRGALPRICVLAAGEVKVKSPWEEKSFICGDGILRIADGGASIITSECKDVKNSDMTQSKADNDGQIEYAKVKIASAINSSK